jgi:hypothetical protein
MLNQNIIATLAGVRVDKDFDTASGARLPSDEAYVRASAPFGELKVV